MSDPIPATERHWLTPGVRGIGAASFLADVGHEIPTALLPNLLTATLGAPAAALGLIEGLADGLAGAARLAGGAIAEDPQRRRAQAVAGYATTAVLSSLIGAASAVWQVGVLRAGAWAARGLRVPARNALLADIVPAAVYGRAYGFERAMDNLGAIAGPLLALALVGLVGVRTAIALSVISGLLAAVAIVSAIGHTPSAEQRERQPLRLWVRPVLTGRLGRLMVGVSAFEFGNLAATLLILGASELLAPGRSQDRATQLALGLYVAYNLAATLASIPDGRLTADRDQTRPAHLRATGRHEPRGATVPHRRPSRQATHHPGHPRRRYADLVYRHPRQPQVAGARPRGPVQPRHPLGHGPTPADGVGGQGPAHRRAQLPEYKPWDSHACLGIRFCRTALDHPFDHPDDPSGSVWIRLEPV